MQVPERLALLGGGILLSSILVFTLKSQASNILPHVNESSSKIYSHIGDARRSTDFAYGYHEAQQSGWLTGHWGTAPWYIDDNDDVYIGGGSPQGDLQMDIGRDAANIKSVNFTKDIQFPKDSQEMLRWLPNVEHINGLDHINTSQVTNISYMFSDDSSLQDVDISSWHTAPVMSTRDMFWNDYAIQDINLSGPDLTKANDQYYMFMRNYSLRQITLGNQTALQKNIGANLASDWKNGNQISILADNNVHPGTWMKQ